MKYHFSLTTIILIFLCCKPASDPAKLDSTSLLPFEEVLESNILDKWYPLVLDTVHGGYLSDFNYKWDLEGAQNKMIVSQARHIWTASKAAELYPDNSLYQTTAAHGADFLRQVMWDKEFGGFYNLVDREGKAIVNDDKIIKQAYGNAFAIYGLAAYYGMSHDASALSLVQEAFLWMEEHSHDEVNGGYFQFLERDGTPIKDGYGNTPAKDQNSSIHLLEAFTELYHVWKNELVRTRLEEMLVLIRDTMTDDRGFLNLFFEQDWSHRSYRDSTEEVRKANHNLDHVSFGHDIETAWLLMEAEEALGNPDYNKTLAIAKEMVDHGLAFGFDHQVGGVYDGGYYFNNKQELEIVKEGKNWWAQVETLNTLLYMSKLFPNDEANYYEKYLLQWDYIDKYLLDKKYGSVYAGGLDKEPNRLEGAKSHIWKGNYHTARALMNCEKMQSM